MRYIVSIDTEKLIEGCVEWLNNTAFPNPLIEISKGSFVMEDYTISLLDISSNGKSAKFRIQMEGKTSSDSETEKDQNIFNGAI
jgi:type III restriction enzyme